MRIGVISDTHGYLDPRVAEYFKGCDEIWHAGDVGNFSLLEELQQFATVRAVYGNIDGQEIRTSFPEHQYFRAGGLLVWMTHIGGYPGRYSKPVNELLRSGRKADIFVCGHSHILKVIFDKKHKMLCINPGAAGINGFHKMKTLLRFSIKEGKPCDMEVVELGLRGQ